MHKENAEYGFRRNLLGMKWIGIVVSLVMSALSLAMLLHGLQGELCYALLAGDAATRPALYVVLGLNVASLVVWFWVVRRGYVRRAADAYSVALLQTLES